MATLDSSVSIAPGVLAQTVQDEGVLLHLETESYFGLNPMATLVWQGLEAGATLRAIHDRILADFAVEAEQLEHDIIDLIEELRQAGLVVAEPGNAARDV